MNLNILVKVSSVCFLLHRRREEYSDENKNYKNSDQSLNDGTLNHRTSLKKTISIEQLFFETKYLKNTNKN